MILQNPGHYFAVVSRIGRGVRQHWPTRRDEEQNGQKRGRREDQSEKEGMRLHPEKRACPRRGNTPTVKAVLDRHQSERCGKGCWDTEPYKEAWRNRQVWVEPFFAEAKDWHSIRRFRLRLHRLIY